MTPKLNHRDTEDTEKTTRTNPTIIQGISLCPLCLCGLFPMEPSWIWPRAAYVHVPFCAHHCGYCDFAVAAGKDHLIDLYIEALAAELATLGEPQPVQTLFLGGGTPTHLSARQLERLLTEIRHWLPLP